MSSPTPLVSGVARQENTSRYSTEADEPDTQPPFTGQCGDVGVVKTAWYSIQGTGTPATVITTGSGFDTVLFAHASWPFGSAVACNDDVSATDLTSLLTFPTTAGTRYLIQATRVAKLTAWSVPAGATVTVSCTSKKLGCRFSSKTASTKIAKTLGLGKIVGKSLTRAKLRKGAKIEVRITSAGQIGTVTHFTFRKCKTPTKATLCMPPGATKPQKVCS
jgi:hypothetical protein